MDPLAQSRNRVPVRRKVRELRDRLSRHLNVGRAARETAATDDSDGSAATSALDRLVADSSATPALAAKRERHAPSITAEGTVSDLVTELRR